MKNKRNKSKQQKMKPQAFGSQQSYCQLRNEANDEATIYIYDVIGGWGIWAVDFIYMLSRITAKTIRVRVHCDGGWVTEAIAMHNALRKHPAHIIVEIDSIAASAASFFIQAGDERVMAENAQLMIHDVQGGVVGTEDEIRAYADYIPTVRDAIVATYDYRTNITADEAREMMTRGTDVYLTAEQALAMGFVDRIEKLADMGEAPQGFDSEPDGERTAFSNQSRNTSAALNELQTIYGLTNIGNQPDNSSVDPGQQDHGNKGESMNKTQLIAELQKTGIDVSALQATANTVETVTNERDTAKQALQALQGKHDAITNVIGERSPEQLTALIATAEAHKASLVDQVHAGRRLSNLCGDSDEDVQADKDTLSTMPVEALSRDAKAYAKATGGKSMLTADATHAHDGDDVSDMDAIAKRMANRKKGQGGQS